jgi:KDO2-lipid IV(A) lauroyltransferase
VDVQFRRRAAEATNSTRFTAWLSILLVRLLSRVAYHTPVRVGYALCDWAGYLLYWRSLRYRRAVTDNLRHVHNGRIDPVRLRRQTITVFRMSARNFWDLLCLPRMSREQLRGMLRSPAGDWERLEELAAAKHGVIIVSAHLGAFDFAGQYIMASEFKPLVLTAPTVSPFFFAGVTYLRASMGTRLEIHSPSSVRDLVRELQRGGMIGMFADRDFSELGWPVKLFDADTTLPVGHVKLARQMGAPLVPWFAVREHTTERRRGFNFYALEPIYIERTNDREADIRRGLEQVVRVYESQISQAPDQWVMFQPVWPASASKRGLRGFAARRAARPGQAGSSDSAALAGPPTAPPDGVDAPARPRPAD